MNRITPFTLLCLGALAAPAAAHGDDRGGEQRFVASLDSFEEVPALAHPGTGSLRMRLLPDDTLEFVLSYENLTAPPLVAHVHFGQRGVAGGVSFFLCGGGSKPACPAATSGTITGTVTAADILGPTAQGVDPGDLAKVLQILRMGLGYANMHTPLHPTGEIRGQVRAFRGRGHWD